MTFVPELVVVAAASAVGTDAARTEIEAELGPLPNAFTARTRN